MPAALAFALFNVGAPLAVVNAVAGVGFAGALLHTVGYAALAAGSSYAANRLLAPPKPKPSDGQTEVRQNVPPRRWQIGELKVSGPLAFWEAREETPFWSVFKVILLNSRRIDSVVKHYLGEEEVTLDGSGFVQQAQYWNDGEPRVRIIVHLGDDNQTTDTLLNSVFTEWGANHRLRGQAYVVIQVRQAENQADHAELFPRGEPIYSALIKGNRYYDPRKDSTVSGGSGAHRYATKSTWEWSDNPALAILDLLADQVDGYDPGQVTISDLHMPSFMAFADLCDEAVTLKAGGTEKRYRVATTLYLDQPAKMRLAALLEACDGHIFMRPDGLIAIGGGEWVAPTVTLDADEGHFLEWDFPNGPDALSEYDGLAFQYMSPAHGYTELEGDPWPNGSVLDTQPVDLSQVPSHGQARRLCKIKLARDNAGQLGRVVTNHYGLDAIGERCIHLVKPELDIDADFWVDSCALKEDRTGVVLAVRKADSTAYDWTAATEEGTAPPVPVGVGPGDGFETVDTVGEIFLPTDVAVIGAVGEAQVAWTNPATTSFGDPVARVWRSTTTDFVDAVDVSGALTGTPSEAKTYDDEGLSAGTYHWWVTAEYDVGGTVQSDPAGPVSDAVT